MTIWSIPVTRTPSLFDQDMVKKEHGTDSAEPGHAVPEMSSESPMKKAKTEAEGGVPQGMTLSVAGQPVRLGTIAAASDRGCLEDGAITKPGLYSKFLAICTNNFKRSGDMHHEKGNTFAVLNFVPMGMIPVVGYTSSPYEPRTDVPKKQRVYFDEKNMPLSGKPVPTMALQDGKLVCRSFHLHPTPALKTKARGEATEVVGALPLGTPMVTFIHDDSKERTMADASTEAGLVPLALISVEMDMRNINNCDTGNGMIVRKVAVLGQYSVHAAGLWQKSLWYNDRSDVRAQGAELLAQNTTGSKYSTDMEFVRRMVSIDSEADQAREQPIVVLDTATAQTVQLDVLPSGLHLRARVGDAGSIYASDDLLVHVDDNEFTMPHTSAEWLSGYYQWCLCAGVANVVVFHDEYRRQKCKEGGSMYAMRAVVAVRHAAVFGRGRGALGAEGLVLSADEADALAQQAGCALDTKALVGWVVSTDAATQTRYAVILDVSKERTPKAACVDVAGDGDRDDGDAARAAIEDTHLSPVCEIYEGMSEKRKVWLAFFCTLRGGADCSVVQAGVQCTARGASRGSAMQMPRDMGAQNYRDLLS